MSTGLYIHRNRKAGEIVDAPMYNGAHQNQLQNDIPQECGAASDTLTDFRTTTDPTTGDGETALPVVDVASELYQLRFVIANIKEVLAGSPPTYWYSPITPTFEQVQAHGARVYRSSSQAIANATVVAASFNTVRYDTGVLGTAIDPFFVIGSPTRLTAPVGGLYEINGFGEWNTGVVSGVLSLSIRLNGGKFLASTDQAVDGQAAFRWQQVSTQYQLNAGDYVELVAFQTMGSPFNLINPEFGLELLNPQAAVPPPPPPTTIPFVIVGALFNTLDTANPFAALGYNGGGVDTTSDMCATLFQDEQTLTSWSVQLGGSALSGTQTLTLRLVIDGTPDATMTIAMAVGDTGGVASGSLLIPAGSLVSVEAVFGGGLTIKTVRGFVFAFDGVPFVIISDRLQNAAAGWVVQGSANQLTTDGGDYEAGFGSGACGNVHPLPGNVIIDGASVHVESTAVSPTTFSFHVGQNSAAFGNLLLPSATQDASDNTLNGTWLPNTSPSNLNAGMAYIGAPSAFTNVRCQIATRYTPDAPYQAYSIIMSALNAGTFSPIPPGSLDTYTILGGDSGIDTTDLVSLRWPNLPGTFKYLVGYAKCSGTGSFAQFSLAVNGSDQITTADTTDSVVSGLISARNDVDTVHVVSGDLVRFHTLVTVDAFGGSFTLGAAVGFLPD